MAAVDGNAGFDLTAARQAQLRDWQRRTAGLLVSLLRHSMATHLPVITWTVTSAAPQLNGTCDGHPAPARREAFLAWKAALTELAGPPDDDHEAHPGEGTTRMIAQWHHYQRVRVVISAEWHVPDPAAAALPAPEQ